MQDRHSPPGELSRFRAPSKGAAARRVARVLFAGVRERAARARPLSAEEVPRSPDEIAAEWLTAALCTPAAGSLVTSVRTGGGSSGTTTRRSLELSYNDVGVAAGLPTKLFAKCTTTLAQRLMLGLGGFLYGEPGFYMRVRPELQIEAPMGYFGAVDRRSWRSIVLIEDVVATRGASFWQPSTRVTRSQIEDLLSSVAGWHGMLWGSARLAGWRWLKTPAEQMRVIDALIGLANRLPVGAERARGVIPSGLRQRQTDLYAALRGSMAMSSQGPPTYLHGDLHIANAYVLDGGGMGVVDWQVGLKGSWAHDYSYIVATAREIEDRRAWEGELLDFYLEHLAAAGGDRIARGRAWSAYRSALLYPYFAWVYTLGRSRLQPNFQPDRVSLTMIERISTAIDDLDSLGVISL
ncbi:MAG: phosphotransferase [Solirubrobacteraceae bacterium]